MRQPGPAPKSTAELKLSGGYRPDRHAQRETLVAECNEFVLPHGDNWTQEETRLWNEVCDAVRNVSGGPFFVDTFIMWQLVQALNRADMAANDIRTSGTTYTTADGLRKRNPAVSIAQAEAALVTRLTGELGLSPTARKKLGIVLRRTETIPDEHDQYEPKLIG